jgi:hypothetical protein
MITAKIVAMVMMMGMTMAVELMVMWRICRFQLSLHQDSRCRAASRRRELHCLRSRQSFSSHLLRPHDALSGHAVVADPNKLRGVAAALGVQDADLNRVLTTRTFSARFIIRDWRENMLPYCAPHARFFLQPP